MSIKAIPQTPKTEVLAPAEAVPVAEVVDTNAVLPPMTMGDLLLIISKMQEQQAASNKELAAAIIETTKHREAPKTPKQIADEKNNELFRQREKEWDERKRQGIKASQNTCDHIAGCSPLSEERDVRGRTDIAWHGLDNGFDVGLCQVCGKTFYPGVTPDYEYWRKKPSICRRSSAGDRRFMDPNRAREDGFLRDS